MSGRRTNIEKERRGQMRVSKLRKKASRYRDAERHEA
jgi:hypothetical protein